ncbi:PIN domain-containing protein [Microbacterium sp. JC 701]|uniref:PIN domain-containing protein n=1 Tax=Microbacterium sp. JC 701 TaxID=2897389 RepID=UPI001E367FCD|nr:PIN domain-containing protein [Microbacterium sp. JC 701]MCD2170442.1 PIN domain-containing protein [Microbacterium sp. JC 701]
MTDYLVDNSVWARLASGDPAIRDRLERIARSPSDLFVTCPPQVVEFCHSACSPEERAHYREQISLGFSLERAPDETLAVGIQSALWNAGLVRAAGTVDILIAAYAIANDATVLSSDHNFAHIAAVSDLAYEYVAPTN